MSQLSMVNQDVLGYVIFHLKKVAEKESKNLVGFIDYIGITNMLIRV